MRKIIESHAILLIYGFIAAVFPNISIANNSALISELDESVVRIVVLFDTADSIALGTGFIVADGIVVTNHHVIEGGRRVKVVQKQGAAIDKHEGEVLWSSPEVDLAIIKSSAVHGIPVRISTGIPQKGADVLAIGFPAAADIINTREIAESTITKGVVGRMVSAKLLANGAYIDVLQHSAQINSGNSGGPLFDTCGALVGVNTAKAFSEIKVKSDQVMVNSIEGVYWAVASKVLANVLTSKNISFNEMNDECQSLLSISKADVKLDEHKGQSPILLASVIVAFGLSVLAIGIAFNRIRHRVIDRAIEPKNIGGKSTDTDCSSSYFEPELRWTFAGRTSRGEKIQLVVYRSQFNKNGSLIIGRDELKCDLVIEDSSVSRKHARLELRGNQLVIHDLDSKNGTRINDVSVSPVGALLITPCAVRLGSLELSVFVSLVGEGHSLK